MRLKLQRQIWNFVGKVALQKWLTLCAQENKDLWAFPQKMFFAKRSEQIEIMQNKNCIKEMHNKQKEEKNP